LVVYCAASEGNATVPTAPTGATLREHIETNSNMPIMTADQTLSSTSTPSGSFTAGSGLDVNPNCGCLVTYKVAGGGVTAHLLSALGAGG
jgi:hypothetical protein